jgi:hypothetical protein
LWKLEVHQRRDRRAARLHQATVEQLQRIRHRWEGSTGGNVSGRTGRMTSCWAGSTRHATAGSSLEGGQWPR